MVKLMSWGQSDIMSVGPIWHGCQNNILHRLSNDTEKEVSYSY